ncbi:GNAT family N-acetyltransferase [Paenibacillus terrigena]|uniref:GNAT family N-acetyltransferase n=1 Tax=Paenibacillus terrigena TaxID=369333 RepID=UPI0028D5BE4D|nr:GNAT family N-acetyltransferase [Paenibacillus terrigena]
MQISIRLTDSSTKFIINNLYPLYLHDLSEIWGWQPNQYGVFEDNDTLTLQEQNRIFDMWWEHPTVLFPYLITVDHIPAGFAMVSTPPYTPHGSAFYMNEFFVMRSFRGQGIAESAAVQVFDRHLGQWELQTNPTESNKRAQSFWRRAIQQYTSSGFEEEQRETRDDGEKLVFRFNNAKK